MPLFYQHTINAGTKLGIWLIEETESFFLEKVPEKEEVTHPHKRLQHLAGRFLLPVLFDDFPLEEIVIADTRKPFLENEEYHFSISHCGSYAAAIVSATSRVVFKWHGRGKLDFKNNMRLSGYPGLIASGWIQLPFIFEKNELINLVVQGKKEGPLMLTWVKS